MSLYTVKPLTSAPHGVWVQPSGQAASPGTRGSRGRVHTAGGQEVVTLSPLSQLVPYGNPGTQHMAGKRCLCCCRLGCSSFPFADPAGRQDASAASTQGHPGATRRPLQAGNTKAKIPNATLAAGMSGSASEMAELLMKEKMKTEEKNSPNLPQHISIF